MNPEHWKKVKLILEEAVEIDSAERRQYLDVACAGDTALRRELDSLLDFEYQTEDVLEQTAFFAVMKNGPSAKNIIGHEIGNYKITNELGSGGMGTVYLAARADGAFEQKVALKIVKKGLDSDAVLRRFFKERQILANLEHSKIARLIDGGTTDHGLPYFVMEYVEGETIINFANKQNLSIEERLNLFREVCQAVSFAHSNLIIHRDLKPSNILVTKGGIPKLLDFGIAKLLKSETSDETATQTFVFTPEYASPEQVRGEKLTTATDIYSLGIILYELLTGIRPFKMEWQNIGEIIRVVSETNPTKPSEAVTYRKTETQSKELKINVRNLKGDIDNIILKSLRKEPERRYLSVEQFSEDIRRHLEGLPVTASKDTWNYRASKFIQRNKIGMAAAGLILLSLIAGLSATLYQANVASRERGKAEQRFADVRQLANSFLFEFHDAVEPLSGSTAVRKLVVSRALEYLDKLAAESENNTALQSELGTAYERIGKIQGNSYYSNLGDTDGAMKSYQRSLEIRQRLANTDPSNREWQYDSARSHRGVGDILYTVNDLKGGEQSYEKGVAILEKIVAAEPNNTTYLVLFADILSRRGDIKGMEGFANLGDTQGALESYRQAIDISEKIVEIEHDDKEHLGDYATRLIYLARLQSATGDAKSAISTGQKAINIFEKLSAANPDDARFKTRLMIAYNAARLSLLDEGRTDEAIESARKVIKTLEGLLAEDPQNAQLRRGLGVTYSSLGTSLIQAQNYQEGIANYRQALKIAEELSAKDTKNTENLRDITIAKQLLAEALIEKGENDTALLNLRQTTSGLEELLKTDESNSPLKESLAACLALIGKIQTTKGDSANALNSFRRAVSIIEEVSQKTSPNIRSKAKDAASYFEAGKALAKLSQNESGEKRETLKLESCNYLKNSLNIWNEMRQAGTLSTINSNRPDEVNKELASCK